MESTKQTRLLQIVMLVVLAATLFNTIQANRFALGTSDFRRETRRQLAATRQALAEQRQLNAELTARISRLEARGAERELVAAE